MYISDDDINFVIVLMNYFKLAGNITWICVESSGFCCVFLPLKFICRYKMYKHFRQRKKNQCHLSKIRLLLSEFYACVKKIHLKIIFKRFFKTFVPYIHYEHCLRMGQQSAIHNKILNRFHLPELT